MIKHGFRVMIKIEEFTYDSKVGSGQREIISPSVHSQHGDWDLGDYDSLDKADGIVAGMVHIKPQYRGDHPCSLCSISFVPMYSSHDQGARKTHLAIDGGETLCGAEKQFSHLLFTQGQPYMDIAQQFFNDPDSHGCKKCATVYGRQYGHKK